MSVWSKSLAVLLALSSDLLIKRQGSVPEACYSLCNSAGIQAQSIGKVPALCDPNGLFELDLAHCTQCIQENESTVNLTILNTFDEYINYCDTLNITNPGFAAAQSALSSVSSQEAALSKSAASLASVQASAESVLGTTSTSSNSELSTVNSPPLSTFATSSASSTSIKASAAQIPSPSPTPLASSRSNNSTIIGAAVGGSIGGVLLLGAALGCFIARRRKKHKAAATAAAFSPPEKAQLHSDDYKPPREELLGTPGKKQYDHTTMSELPSNEPVEKKGEMPANEEVGSELDNRVVIPVSKTDLSSQTTKVASSSDT